MDPHEGPCTFASLASADNQSPRDTDANVYGHVKDKATG